jgi:hypothetical protein
MDTVTGRELSEKATEIVDHVAAERRITVQGTANRWPSSSRSGRGD